MIIDNENIKNFLISDCEFILKVVEEAIKINEEIQINRTESLDSELMQLKNERKCLIERIEKGK